MKALKYWAVFFIVLRAFTNGDYEEDLDFALACPNRTTDYGRLGEDLLCNYDMDMSPKKDDSTLARVWLNLRAASLDWAGDVRLDTWVILNWVDERLVWDLKKYNSIDMYAMEASDIWTPDLGIFDIQEDPTEGQEILGAQKCNVSPNGKVRCAVPHRFATKCRGDSRNFPFDILNCSIRLSSFVQSTRGEVKFDIEKIVDKQFQAAGVKLLKIEMDKSVKISDLDDKIPVIRLFFYFQRNSASSVNSLVIPKLVVALIMSLVFWMNPRKAERYWTLICVLISEFTMLVSLTNHDFPVYGDRWPIIIVSIIVTGYIIVFTAILSLATKQIMDIKEPLPPWIVFTNALLSSNPVSSAVFPVFSQIHVRKTVRLRKETEEDPEQMDGSESVQESNNDKWIIVGKLVDRVAFYVVVSIYSALFLILVS